MGSILRGLAAGSLAIGLLAAGAAADEVRTSFLVFIADDMAWDDCGAYDHPSIKTPNLDRLAREGMRFERAFLTCSSCSPSRASILTGRYPHNTGAEQLHWPLPASQTIVSEPLTAAGYWTAAIGKWHLGEAAKSKFAVVSEGLGKWQSVLAQRPDDKPFFVWFAFSDPHRPYQKETIAQPHRPRDVRVPPYLPDVDEVRRDLAMYYDEISRLDGVVGQVLDLLDQQQASKDTFVLFMSDNGRPFPRDKTTLYDSGIQTPLIVRFPGRVQPGTTSTSLVSSIDVAPTVLELAGVAQPRTFQGVSFRPLLSDPGTKVRDYIFAEHNWHDYTAHDRAVRSVRYKYIRNSYTELNLSPPADAVRSPTFQAMVRLREENKLTPRQMQCFVVPRPAEELYDLQADPYELHNLAADEKHAAPLAALRRTLDQWQRETGDRKPPEMTPDEFDRHTGEKLPGVQRRMPTPELRAEVVP